MEFCIIHGWAHYPGETESVHTVGDDLDCRVEQWPAVVEGEVIGSQWKLHEEPYFTVAAGNLAYLSTVEAGLVPVKVGTITDDEVEVRITAGRPGYERGEILNLRAPNPLVVSRDQVHRSRGQYRIAGPVRMVTDEGDVL